MARPLPSRHVSITIDRPAADVYDFATNPVNLPQWAAGLASGVELVDGQWTADSPMGHITVTFAERNPFGVADHEVTVPSGETFANPMRVIAAEEPSGASGCEVVFMVRQRAGMTAEDLERDAQAVQADLESLRTVLER